MLGIALGIFPRRLSHFLMGLIDALGSCLFGRVWGYLVKGTLFVAVSIFVAGVFLGRVRRLGAEDPRAACNFPRPRRLRVLKGFSRGK